jgi:hypothetical protein
MAKTEHSSSPELFETAASIIHALAVRLLDLSQAIRNGQRTAEVARHVERLLTTCQAALKEITPSIRELAKVRR